MRSRPHLVTLLSTALVAGACVGHVPEPDVPAPASERRLVLRLHLDLERGQRCEEAFDSALYQDRGIELIEWDGGRGCEDRTAAVRFVASRTSQDSIVRAARQAGAKALVLPPGKGDGHENR